MFMFCQNTNSNGPQYVRYYFILSLEYVLSRGAAAKPGHFVKAVCLINPTAASEVLTKPDSNYAHN